MSTSVKRIESTQRGAPTLSGTAGTLLAVLEALFVTGWGPTTALSVNVSGGIATATLTPGESFDRDAVVLVAGATPSELNGEARVLSRSNSSISWATTAPDGAATGTITIRYAPQTSWSKVYAATNKAVFRSTHVQSAGHYLRIDDTGTTTARVRGYESMTDVDTGTGPFPTDAQLSGGGYLHKSWSANTTAVKYRIFCDERFIVISIAAAYSLGAQYLGASPRGFGDPIALAPSGDVWATLISVGGSSASGGAGSAAFDSTVASSASGMTAAPRSVSGLGGSVLLNPRAYTGKTNSISGADDYLGSLPSNVDGQIKTSRMFVAEAAAYVPRAQIPGVLYVPQSGALGPLADGDVMDGSGDLAGRKLMVVPELAAAAGYNSPPSGVYLVDITGPWR